MKIITTIFCAALCITSSSCGLTKTTSSLFAKEVCSCIFVSNQDENYCVYYGQPALAIGSYVIDSENKTVMARKFISKSKASYISKQKGCELVE